MIPRSNLHCHSRFSDGSDSMEKMVQAAIEKGFVSLGFSEHAYAPYDSACCMAVQALPAYRVELGRLREMYGKKIELYAGLENDSFYPAPKECQDFTIASVHYVRDMATGTYFPVDYRPDHFEDALHYVAGGDVHKLVKLYFEQLVAFVEDYRPDIVGHLDLIVKNNKDNRYFDEESIWYREVLLHTVGRIASAGCIVEVNTGGIARGYRAEPYPSRWLLEQLLRLDVPVTISSDAHTAEDLDFAFDAMEDLLRDVGYRSIKQLRGGTFVDVSL